MPTRGFSTKPLKVKLLTGEQKATEISKLINGLSLGNPVGVIQEWNAGEAAVFWMKVRDATVSKEERAGKARQKPKEGRSGGVLCLCPRCTYDASWPRMFFCCELQSLQIKRSSDSTGRLSSVSCKASFPGRFISRLTPGIFNQGW